MLGKRWLVVEVTSTLPIGYVLGDDYEIVGVLGTGGFSNTYVAHDNALSRDVAIKEYYPRDITTRDANLEIRVKHQRNERAFTWGLERFIQEAKLLAKFRHPNIVRVFRTFDANNTGYIVLDYIQGEELEGWLRSLGRRPTQTEIDELLAPLVDALGVVHQVGVLHRDIKPANIVIRDETGSPILLDFGASKYSMSELTGTTMAIVSRGYSPYEAYAADSGSQGPWTDIYGLGATIYRALTDVAPPEATERLLDDTLAPLKTSGLTGYRSEFLAAIDWALQVQPKARPATVALWQAAMFRGIDPRLLSWQATSSHSTTRAEAKATDVAAAIPTIADTGPQPKKSSASSILFVLLSCITVGGGVFAAYYFKRPLPTVTATGTPVASAPASTLSQADPPAPSPAAPIISSEPTRDAGSEGRPDQKIAMPAPSASASLEVAKPKPQYLAKKYAVGGGSSLTAASVSVDGKSIAIGDDRGALKQLDIATGSESTLAKLAGPVTAVASVGDDARLVAAASGDGSIVLVDTQSKSVRNSVGTAARPGGFVKALAHSSLTGEIIAVDTSAGASRLTRWPLSGSSMPSAATDIGGGILRAAFISRGSDLAVVVSADERIRSLRYTSGQLDSAFDWIPPAAGWTASVALSPDATLLARGGQYQSIEVFDQRTKSSKLTVNLGDQAFVRVLAFSADGRRLAIDYTTHTDAAAAHRMMVVDTESGRQIADITRTDDAGRWVSFLPAAGDYWIASSSRDAIRVCPADEHCNFAASSE
ncbi:MAG: serine/threonine-protein kinase [Hyphomicrobiaceae bacterium]